MHAFDRDLIRGGHHGRRSCEPRKHAEYMAAPTHAVNEVSSCLPGAVQRKPTLVYLSAVSCQSWTENNDGAAKLMLMTRNGRAQFTLSPSTQDQCQGRTQFESPRRNVARAFASMARVDELLVWLRHDNEQRPPGSVGSKQMPRSVLCI